MASRVGFLASVLAIVGLVLRRAVLVGNLPTATGQVLAAGVLSHVSMVNVLLLLVVGAGMAVRMAAEERLIVESYPEYVEYAARTKRVIPFVC